MGTYSEFPHLGVLRVELSPERPCRFQASPAGSLRASLLRRLELFDPELSQALHEAEKGVSALRPWTVSPLLGPLTRQGHSLTAEPQKNYHIQLTALAPRVLEALHEAFFSDHPLAQEPLSLEHVFFHVLAERTRWEQLTTYPALLSNARPRRRISLAFRSPTGFRRRDNSFLEPAPRLCLTGYLRKWNAFSNVALPEEPLLAYAEDHLKVARQDLRPAPMRFGEYEIPGVVGSVEWHADGEAPALLRLVNALADYASYCGTGIMTAQGMGQTVRLMGTSSVYNEKEGTDRLGTAL